MKKDKEISDFFHSQKPQLGDGNEFIRQLDSKMGYYRHYEALIAQLEQERRRQKHLYIALTATFILCGSLLVALSGLPEVSQAIDKVISAIKTVFGSTEPAVTAAIADAESTAAPFSTQIFFIAGAALAVIMTIFGLRKSVSGQ